MKKPTNKELLQQLEEIQWWCVNYNERNPRNHGEYAMLAPYYKPLRDGIVFYSSGWGWRLRKNWQNTIFQKRLELLADESGISMTEPTVSASNTGLQSDGASGPRCKVCGRKIGKKGHILVAMVGSDLQETAAYCGTHWRKLGE